MRRERRDQHQPDDPVICEVCGDVIEWVIGMTWEDVADFVDLDDEPLMCDNCYFEAHTELSDTITVYPDLASYLASLELDEELLEEDYVFL